MSKKKAILRAATRLFAEKGFQDTSIAEIAQATGTVTGTVFYHFKTKEDLFVAVLENLEERIVYDIDEFIGKSQFESGMDMVEGMISFYLYMAGMKEDWFLLLHHRYPYELAEVNATCRDHLEAIYNCFVDIFERGIRLGQQDGSINDMPARKTAMILFALVDGMVRFKILNLYDAGALYNELIRSCHRMLHNPRIKQK